MMVSFEFVNILSRLLELYVQEANNIWICLCTRLSVPTLERWKRGCGLSACFYNVIPVWTNRSDVIGPCIEHMNHYINRDFNYYIKTPQKCQSYSEVMPLSIYLSILQVSPKIRSNNPRNNSLLQRPFVLNQRQFYHGREWWACQWSPIVLQRLIHLATGMQKQR